MATLLLESGIIEACPDREKWSVVMERFSDHLRMPINYAFDKG